MALRKPLVLVNGKLQQLQASDTIVVATSNTDVQSLTNGEATPITVGMCVYISAAATVKKALANAAATANAFGMVYDVSITNAAIGQIATFGLVNATTTAWDAVTGQTGGLTQGADYYMDPTTAGKITSTPPSTVGQYVVNLGTAQDTQNLQFNPQIEILL